MAQATKKSTSKQTAAKKKTPAKSTNSAGRHAVSKNMPVGNPAKRAIGAVVCLLLGLFSFIGYFNVDAWFITYFCGFIKGIVGWGYFIFPPALLVCAFTLLTRKNKPVSFRVVSALMLPLFLGAIYHLFSAANEIEFTKSIISVLYKNGKEMTSGGVLSGLLAMGLKSAVSIYGAAPVFTVGLIFFGMNCVGITVPKLIESYRNRSQYEPITDNVQNLRPLPAAPMQARTGTPVTIGKKHIKAFDIPLDEANLKNDDYIEEKVGFFNTKPRVKTPDQVLSQDAAKPPVTSAKTIKRAAPTDNVKPLSVEEAAAVAGVSQLTSEGSGATSAIKKISHDEVEAETEEITKTIEKTIMAGSVDRDNLKGVRCHTENLPDGLW